MGITCALCHSIVDDRFATGIGQRLDGWPNRDLDVGAIVGSAPDLKPFTDLLGVDDATVRTVLARLGSRVLRRGVDLDGKAVRPDGKSAATRSRPCSGSWVWTPHVTGFGSVTYWNAYVAASRCTGRARSTTRASTTRSKYPVAASPARPNVRYSPDLVTVEAGPASVLPARASRRRRRRGQLRRGGRRRGKAIFDRQGALRELPRAAADGARLNMHKPAEIRIGLLPGRPLTRRHVPHAAAQGPVRRREGRLLPRRALPEPGRGGRPLRQLLPARLCLAAEVATSSSS